MKTILQSRLTLSSLAALAIFLCQTGQAAPPPVSNYETFASALSQTNVVTNFVNNSLISLTTTGQTFQIATNTLIDAGTNNVTIDGNLATRLFFVHTNCQLILANLILTNGSSTNGGAIYSQGALVISNCIFAENSAIGATGLAGAAGTPNSTDDTAGSGGNGGSVLGGAIYSTGPVFTYYSLFASNAAAGGAGGAGGSGLITADNAPAGNGGNGGLGGTASGAAIYSSGTNNIFFATEFLSNNCAGGVGGAGGAAGTNLFYPSLDGATGQGGYGGYAAGGAVWVTGSLSASNCLFAYNTVTGGGCGAAAVDMAGYGYDGNNGGATYGGGLIIYSSTATAYLENTIFFANTCTGGAGAEAFAMSSEGGEGGAAYGGGIYVSSSATRMRNCTVASNFLAGGTGGTDSGTNGVDGPVGAAAGWEIFCGSGAADLANSILAGVTASATNVIDAGYNISSDGSMTRKQSTSLINTAPDLDSGLSAQGGPALGPTGLSNRPATWTLALIDGSPATNAIAGVPGLTFPATDERLMPRGTPASIGAFEVASDIITVTNAGPASIASQPSNQLASLGKTAFLSVVASPNPGDPNNLGYQWQLNGTNLPEGGNFSGVNTPNLEIKSVADADLGEYQVVISPSLLDSVTNSQVAYLLVDIPTTIVAQPVSRFDVPVGSVISFALKVGGAPPFYFQWRTNGVPLADGNEFSGSATTNLTINPVTLPDAASYTVVVSNYFRTLTSVVAHLTVVPDKTRPTVLISAPALNARTNNLIVSGTATDNAQVTNVFCWVTNIFAGTTNWFLTNAILSTNETLTKTWAVSNVFAPGTNIVAVESIDYSGNLSTVTSRKFFYIVPSTFRLSENNLNFGSVSGTASVVGNAKPTNGATLNVGEGYNLVATPSTGYLLSNWVSAGFVSYSKQLSFTMTTNLAIQANFVPTPFTAVEGTYNGLFFQTNTNGVTEQSAGMLSALTIHSLGSYTAQLLLGGVGYPISGTFDILGHSSNYISRIASKGGPVELEMDLGWTNSQVTGLVSPTNKDWESSLVAEENASSFPSAQSTMLLAASTNAIGEAPPGFGYILLTNHLGALTLSGALPDGAAFSQHVPLGILGDVPLYESLYNNAGMILGWITLTNGLPQGTNGLIWIKPSSKTEFYPDGLTNELAVQGSPWTNGSAFSASGMLTISNASLNLTHLVSIHDTTVTRTTNTGPSLTGIVNPKTGQVTITFGTGTGAATILGYGAILENTSTLGGYFITKTNAGLILLSP
jgi:predicted outer membrane repeat protein